jgi:hypothetical protein
MILLVVILVGGNRRAPKERDGLPQLRDPYQLSRHERKESERFKSFSYEELAKVREREDAFASTRVAGAPQTRSRQVALAPAEPGGIS